MLIAVCGKSNTGKTCFWSATTLVDAEIRNRILTTIKPNHSVAYFRAKCPCKELGVSCQPQNSKCINGTRYVPTKLIDIAGLVPGAHEGRGLGNAFLSDIMEASALIHIVDISGGTDQDGNPVETGSHSPLQDIEFLENEIDFWLLGILQKNWVHIKNKARSGEKPEDLLHKQLSGLGISPEDISLALKENNIMENDSEESLLDFIKILRKKSKPILIAGNKIDVPGSGELLKKARNFNVIPCSAESELALRKAAEKGVIEYNPGDPDFKITGDIDDKQRHALELIRDKVLKPYGSTGVQKILDSAAFDLLGLIAVYPVENETRYTSKKGFILPDAYLVPKGTTARELAGKIHTEFADKFIAALDARTKQRISSDHELKNGDVIKIMLSK